MSVYPTLDYVSADSVGRQSGRVLHMAYGRGQYGGPNWHPNNYAHCAWGYQLCKRSKTRKGCADVAEP